VIANQIAGALGAGAGGGGGGSYESIATATGTGSSNTITFSSISTDYKHLQIRGLVRNTGPYSGCSELRVRLNGSSSAEYASHYLAGGGSSAFAGDYSASETQIRFYQGAAMNNNTADIMSVMVLDIHDYASSTKNKTLRFFAGADFNNTNGIVTLQSGLRVNTAAVTSVSLIAEYGSWNTQTTFALYGIKG
jgi:hypothetical protein